MAGEFTVPDLEQAALMGELGLTPEEYAVVLSSEDTLWLMHYRSRHEVVVHINRRVLNDRK